MQSRNKSINVRGFHDFMFRFVVMYVILFYHSSTIYAVINGVIFQVRFTETSREHVDQFVQFQSLAILAISSHMRTMLTDPGAVPR